MGTVIDIDVVGGLRWRYERYIRPYQVVHRSPLAWAQRAVGNLRAAHAEHPVAYVYANPTNTGDYVSHLGVVSLTGLAGVQLLCDPVARKTTLASLGRNPRKGRRWSAVFVGGGGLLQGVFDDFWAGILDLDLPLVVFGVGAAEAGSARRVTSPTLLTALGRRALAIHTRDRYTRDLLVAHGATRVTTGVCPSVDYLLAAGRTCQPTSSHLLHVVHDPDLRIAGLNPDEIRRAVRGIARDLGLAYDELTHQAGFNAQLITRYQRAALVISSRLHGCIFSYALSKPFVALACDRKVDAFVRDYAPQAPCIASDEAALLSDMLLPRAIAAVAATNPGAEAERSRRAMSAILRTLNLKPADLSMAESAGCTAGSGQDRQGASQDE